MEKNMTDFKKRLGDLTEKFRKQFYDVTIPLLVGLILEECEKRANRGLNSYVLSMNGVKVHLYRLFNKEDTYEYLDNNSDWLYLIYNGLKLFNLDSSVDKEHKMIFIEW